MTAWNRRTVLQGLGAAATASLWWPTSADALGLPEDKIKAVRYYSNSGDINGRGGQPMVNQSSNVIVIETQSGLKGIGEGGEPRTMEEAARMLIGKDPFRIEQQWQRMMRGMFYPAGREKLHSLGGLDLALWDLKGKALGVPIWQLLGGKSRNYVECYSTGFPRPQGGSLADRAKACRDAGFRVFRHSTDNRTGTVERFSLVSKIFADCETLQKVTGDGGWALDFHTEFDPPDAMRLLKLIDDAHLAPYFLEDPIRSENVEALRNIRLLTHSPLAVGEQFGYKWDANQIIEENLVNYLRATLPNVGGISEYMKLIAMCETHYMGMIPHFCSPIAEAALVHCLTATSIPALMEMVGDGNRNFPYLPKAYDFRDGKMWPNDRPGLGVEIDESKLKRIGVYDTYEVGMPNDERPDGSYTNW
jgi:L-alanine-DL-glutamate epimerase-like enolase superfamily enzyme